MNILLKSGERTLLSLANDELFGIVNALNELCNGVRISDEEFSTRLGVDRAFLATIHQQLLHEPSEQFRQYELVGAWAEPASVMVRAVTVFGDPVEMSTSEAETLVGQLRAAIAEAK